MSTDKQSGFSLIELLLVVVVIGIIATVAIPALQKSVWAAQTANAVSALRTISSAQMTFYSQTGRFGRLTEINNILGGFGTPIGSVIRREEFEFRMIPMSPTNQQLQDSYTIIAWRVIQNEGLIYVYELNQSGEIRQILP